MRNVNLGQILVGAALLTAAFYIGINYKSKSAEPQMNSVTELANEDLSFKKPLIPVDESIASRDKVESVRPSPSLSAPPLTKKESSIAQLPPVELPKNFDDDKSVEPDFSRLPKTPVALRDSRQAATGNGDSTDPSDRLVGDRMNRDTFKPLIPPDPKDFGTVVTPELAEFDPRPSLNDTPRVAPTELSTIGEKEIINNPNRKGAFQVHVIRDGESLRSIAKRYYHSDDYYLDLYVANQGILSSPIKLPAGTTIKIPDLPKR